MGMLNLTYSLTDNWKTEGNLLELLFAVFCAILMHIHVKCSVDEVGQCICLRFRFCAFLSVIMSSSV